MITNKWAFLGPYGTNSEQAAIGLKEKFDSSANLIAYESIFDAMMAVEKNIVSHCVVPVENSTEGSVRITLDTLASTSLIINAELKWKVEHNLLVLNKFAPIHTIISHAQALSQCREYLKKYYPNAKQEAVSSTARAAEKIAELGNGFAAIANTSASKLYNLHIVDNNISDLQNNFTRFLLLSHKNNYYINHNTSSMMLICTLNGRAGSLYELLGDFAKNKINMTRIESRPLRDISGDYMFFIDIETGEDNYLLKKALEHAKNRCSMLKIVGKY